MRKGPLGDRMHRFSQDSLQGHYREITYSTDLARDKVIKNASLSLANPRLRFNNREWFSTLGNSKPTMIFHFLWLSWFIYGCACAFKYGNGRYRTKPWPSEQTTWGCMGSVLTVERLWQALERNVKIVRSLRDLSNTDVRRFLPRTDANRHLSKPTDEPNEI